MQITQAKTSFISLIVVILTTTISGVIWMEGHYAKADEVAVYQNQTIRAIKQIDTKSDLKLTGLRIEYVTAQLDELANRKTNPELTFTQWDEYRIKHLNRQINNLKAEERELRRILKNE